MLLDSSLSPYLMEANNNPSLSVGEVHPVEAPRPRFSAKGSAKGAPGPPPLQPKVCRCMAHFKPHVHTRCAIDVGVKSTAVGGALEIVRRSREAFANAVHPTDEELAHNTCYDPVSLLTANAGLKAFAAAVEENFPRKRENVPSLPSLTKGSSSTV